MISSKVGLVSALNLMVWVILVGLMVSFITVLTEKKIAPITGLTKLGIEKVPPMVTRGVLFDMTKVLGVEYLKAGQTFSIKELQLAEKSQGVKVQKRRCGAFSYRLDRCNAGKIS